MFCTVLSWDEIKVDGTKGYLVICITLTLLVFKLRNIVSTFKGVIPNSRFQTPHVQFVTLWLVVEVNPKVRVRSPEEEEECVYPENDNGSWMLSKFIELLYFEEKEKNERECAASVSKSTRVCPQHVTMRSTPSTKGGVWKSVKRVGESPKENARASCVIRPRAVLSSPENDGLIGSMNELKNSTRSGRKEDGRGKKGGKYLEREECEAFNKGKAPLKAKVHFRNL
ncbi:uncharacterized protein LOC108325617 [Vigna angularis]|uniref:uncharacterized protein LOC108325617 n=1 Tax=Phaseolus angularis TaxID=3914 RepID=UPI0022B40BEA|nr:uncharacterized protein LOC108325617 [Vigna angularis]